MDTFWICVLLFFATVQPFTCNAQHTETSPNHDPETALISTADIEIFLARIR